MKYWRKVHLFSFGYFKLISAWVCIHMLLINITGVLLNHRHTWTWLEKIRVSTSLLPGRYQVRLDTVREVQGIADLFPEEAHSVPLMWLIYDFHTGDILGSWGRLFYDLIALSFIVLTVTGIYMFLRIRRRKRF